MELYNQPTCTVEVEYVGDTMKPDAEKTFIKRLIGVIVTDKVNGSNYSRKVTLQATGNTDKPIYDKTPMLNNIMPGMLVDIDFTIRGSVKVNEKLPKTPQNPGQLEGFNNIEVTAIKQHIPMQQPQYGGYPQPGGYAPPPQYGQPVYGGVYQQPAQGAYQPAPNYQPAPPSAAPHQGNAAAATPNTPNKIPRPAGAAPKDVKGEDMVWNDVLGSWEEMPF